MDKQTLSNYGWVVITTLILAVMLAFSTPFGMFVGNGISNTVMAYKSANEQAMNNNNISRLEQEWEDKLNVNDNNNDGADNGETEIGGIEDETETPPGVGGFTVCEEYNKEVLMPSGLTEFINYKAKRYVMNYENNSYTIEDVFVTENVNEDGNKNYGYIEKFIRGGRLTKIDKYTYQLDDGSIFYAHAYEHCILEKNGNYEILSPVDVMFEQFLYASIQESAVDCPKCAELLK